MKLSDSKSMRDADQKAIQIVSIPSTLLMTNAAQALCDEVLKITDKSGKVTIFCGSGNNGGDGIGTAVFLIRQGVSVRCFLVGKRDKMSSDACEMERRLIELGGGIETFSPEDAEQVEFASNSDVIIDAVFGIGLSRNIRGIALDAVRLINSFNVPVISADIASGIMADNGRVAGDAVYADITVTFTMAKIGHFVEEGSAHTGILKVTDIGIPKNLVSEINTGVFAINPNEVNLPARKPVSHKSDYGKLLLIGGCVGYTGAIEMSTKAAVRSGAGLVSVGVPNSIYDIMAVKFSEPMPFPLADTDGKIGLQSLHIINERLEKNDVCVIGCGMNRSNDISRLMRSLLAVSSRQLVIDADGLFALGNDPNTISTALKPPILTPHDGEYKKLGGQCTGDRVADARQFATERQCILVLKGHRTICAFPDGEVYIINAGNPGMSKGGSGDVLAGIIGAMLCQMPVKKAVTTACAIHAIAGDACAKKYGEYSMTPTDIINIIPEVTKKITAKRGKLKGLI